MKSKTKKILRSIITVVISLFIGSGAVLKMASFPVFVELYSKIGLLPYLQLLGMTELLFLGLFIWKRTMKTGFLLLTAYYGGAIAVELSHGSVFIAPAVLLALIWIAAYLRDASLFSYKRPVDHVLPILPGHLSKRIKA